MTGKYIVIEGPDGTGKTTQAQLLANKINDSGGSARYVHEPGETPMGLELERTIKNRELSRSSLTDLLLFTANRIELYNQVIKPEIDKGNHIIADRNWISSIVYQGFASGLDIETIRRVTTTMLPEQYSRPDATILLSLSSERRQQLLGSRGTSDRDYFETKPDDFQRRLIEGYESIADDLQLVSESVSASGTIDEVHGHILSALGRTGIIV